MPLTRAAQQKQEADTVRSRPGRDGYPCPTIADVDRYLGQVHAKLAGNLTRDERRRFADDQNALLDRRWYLMEVSR